MSSLIEEEVLITVPNGSTLGTKLGEINVKKFTCQDIIVTGTFNGEVVSGGIVFTNSVQTLTNKILSDDTVSFANTTTNSQVFMSAAGTAGTSAVLEFQQTADRLYSVPDPGLDSDFVLTEGVQTINGTKSFADLNISGGKLSVDKYKILTGTTTTTGGATSAICTSPTASNTAYLYNAKVVAATSTGVHAVYKKSVRVKNVAGVLSLGTEFDIWYDTDSDISTSGVTFAISGQDIVLNAAGVIGFNLTWSGIVEEVRIEF